MVRGSSLRAMRLLRALRIVHPFPTAMNVAATGGLALLATESDLGLGRLLRLMLTMLAIQSAIGAVNDLRDYELDALSKPGKPLVSGAIAAPAARAVAFGALIAAVVLAAGFGFVAWLLAMIGLTCGLVYDLWLKRTAWSALPYALALPLLPLWVWVAVGQFRPLLLLLIPLGLLLGLSLHLANSLPDYEADAVAAVRGLAHRLGFKPARYLCWGCFALTIVLIAASTGGVRYRLSLLAPGLGLSALSLAVAILVYQRRPSSVSLQLGWIALVLGSAALALAWLGALQLG